MTVELSDHIETQLDDPKSSRFARAKRVKSLRNMTRLSRRAFSERYGIPAGTLQNWEDARANGLSEKGARKIIRVLKAEGIHVSFEWLMHGIGPGPTFTESLYMEGDGSSSRSGSSSQAQASTDDNQTITSELLLFRQHFPEAIDIVVNDDGMLPRFTPGEYVAGNRRYQQHISKVVGQECIVQTAMGDVMLRLVKKGTVDGIYNLVCTNPHSSVQRPVLYDIELISAAPVIWSRRKDQ